MARFDRYMLSQMLRLFGLCALVLVAVFWINRGVVLFDRLIGDGQTALVFLEFTALSLPRIIVTVLPIATFCASVYITNRLNNESELTVMLATGTGPWRLVRPVLVYGIIVALMMSVLTHILMPASQAQLVEREAEISRNMTARLLNEGEFLTPTSGVAFYSREISNDGILRDVFLADRRNPQERIIYTAAEAYLVREGDSTSLIMVNGLAQRLTMPGQTLSTATFSDFAFDISSLVSNDGQIRSSVQYMITPTLMADWDVIAAVSGASEAQIAEELHGRFTHPLFCIVTALIGFTTLLVGGYSRFGVWREAVLAFLLLLALDGLRNAAIGQVLEDAKKWPLLYLPSLIGMMLAGGMLWFASRTRWRRRVATA